jgi:hypothetical protein
LQAQRNLTIDNKNRIKEFISAHTDISKTLFRVTGGIKFPKMFYLNLSAKAKTTYLSKTATAVTARAEFESCYRSGYSKKRVSHTFESSGSRSAHGKSFFGKEYEEQIFVGRHSEWANA